MINRTLLKTLTMAWAILAIAFTAASADNTRDITFHTPVKLNGVQLSEGHYKLNWQARNFEVAGKDQVSLAGQDPEVTVTFTQKDKVVATLQGTLVDRDADYNRDAVIYRTNPDGTRTIAEIRFKKAKQAIVFKQ